MKNGLYFFCFLIFSATLFTSCGNDTATDNPIVGIWDLELVDGTALPKELQITFEFRANGIAIRKNGAVETLNQWTIKDKEAAKTRFLHITDPTDKEVNEQLEIKRLDATTLVLLDGEEAITLTKQK